MKLVIFLLFGLLGASSIEDKCHVMPASMQRSLHIQTICAFVSKINIWNVTYYVIESKKFSLFSGCDESYKGP